MMRHLKTFRREAAFVAVCLSFLFSAATSFAQVPPTPPALGTTSTYGAFTEAGAIGNTGLTKLTGDIGTNAGAFTGFPPGMYTGAKHVADPQSLVAKNDLTTAYNQGNLIPCDTTLNVTMGNGQVLTPRTYCLGPASTLTGNLTFDGKGHSNSVFIVKIGGALNAAANTHVILLNGAQAVNIYWIVNGAVSILDNSIFKGTIIANGAIHLYGGTTLEGRALSVVGAITMASNIVSVPVDGGSGPNNTLIVVTPAPGDTIKGGTQGYHITWAGTGIGQTKTFEYSLDSGATWHTIGTQTSDAYSYNWNVPDTVSNKAIVRITDNNGLTAKSGLFTIVSSKTTPGSITVITPAAGEIVVGKTQNYQITYSGTAIDPMKTFEYSLDGGLTWTMIGTINSDAMTFNWNVPDTSSTNAMVRITDAKGAVGKSGIFVIKPSKPGTGNIVVIHPAAGEIIAGGAMNYAITWSGSNIAATKTFEYSLDGGSTWTLIGVLSSDAMTYNWATVPNVATTQALIRITDANHVVGTSGLFTITKTNGVGSINSVTLTGLDMNQNIGNNKQLGIQWTFTPDIGTSVLVEYSLDQGFTWHTIGTVQTTETPATTWMTVPTGFYNPVYIRVTSSKGMTAISQAFSIGSKAGVNYSEATAGYSVKNYPNPVSASTNISFVLPVPSDVTLTITNVLGNEVGNVATAHFDAGTHNITFDASNLLDGTYNYALHAGQVTIVGRMIVVK